MISFSGKKRLFGEEAFAQIASESTIGLINLLVGRSLSDAQAHSSSLHRKIHLLEDSQGRLMAEIKRANDDDEPTRFHITSLLAMYLAHLNEQITTPSNPSPIFCFALYPQFTPRVARAYRDACAIAGIDTSRVRLVDSANALVTTYARKVNALGGPRALSLCNQMVMLVDMGHVQTTVCIVMFPDTQNTQTPNSSTTEAVLEMPRLLAVTHDHNLGAHDFDNRIFDHFASACLLNHSTKVN